MATIFGDVLTYQYSDEGQICTQMGASMELTFDETVRERYQAAIRAEYADFPGAWERLVELSRKSLEALPDNPFAQEQAWLCGVHPDGGERVAKIRQQAATERSAVENAEEHRKAAFAEAAATGKRQFLHSFMDGCDGTAVDCSMDSVTIWALPDGTTMETRTHAH